MLAHVDNRITYNGNGNATEFAYQFKILDRTDIKVLLTDADGKEKLLTKDYYVDVEKSVVRYPGYAVGAEVPESERPAVLPTGWKLTISREVPVTQETDLPDQYPFNQVEAIGDKLTMIAQQLTDTTGRSLKIGVSKSTDIDTVIPWENGKSFRISDDGKTLELSEDPAKVLPLAQGVYAQTQAQAQSAAASATAAAKSEDSAFKSAGVAGNSAQYASLSAASASENAELTSGYKQEALTAKADAAASATNAKASEANAKTSENNAEASKEAAQSAATAASNFASAARNSAGEAKTYKDNAKTYMDNAELYMNNAKNYSENVNVFVPSVSSAGVLSWTNKAGLPNPASVNIKGVKGDAGTAATITIGSVTTGEPGTNASVTNSGTSSAAVLDFVLPKGKDGADGGVTVDKELSSTSTNPVQNNVIYNALLNKVGTDIFSGFTLLGGGTKIMWREGTQSIGAINAANYSGTARGSIHDGDGNVITSTYATKTELNSCVKTVNNVTPDENGNVNISVSGGTGGNITVDSALSSTSTNPVQNKVIKDALDDTANLNKNNTFLKENWFEKGVSLLAYRDSNSAIKWYQSPANPPVASIDATNYTGTAARATQDGAGNVIIETYAKKADVSGVVKSVNNIKPDSNGNVTITVSGGSDVTVDTTLSATSTNPIANKAVYNALSDKLGKTETAYAATKATQDGEGNTIATTYIKFINGNGPDASGNVNVSAGGGGVSTSVANTWTAVQEFYNTKTFRTCHTGYFVEGTRDTPETDTMWYTTNGDFTLNLSNFAMLLGTYESIVFSAYFTADADHALTIRGAGTMTYIGSASDIAISGSGTLLTVWMIKNSNGVVSIVQAHKLGSGT